MPNFLSFSPEFTVKQYAIKKPFLGMFGGSDFHQNGKSVLRIETCR